MSTPQEAPALIQYACERCKTRFVLPPSSRHLSIAGKFRAFSTGLGRTFRFHEGVGVGYDTARRQLLAKMDDEAYQSFVQSFRFCHECRQFVCNECWSTSRRSCLTCVAKSMTGTVRPRPPFAPTGPDIPRPIVTAALPRRGRLRRDVTLVALAVAIVLLALEGGVLLNAVTSPGPTPDVIFVTPSPSASPTASPSPTAIPTASPTEVATASPTAGPSASPTAAPSASPTAAPTAAPTVRVTPRPTAAPTAAPTTPPATPTPVPAIGPVTINCGVAGTVVTCSASYSARVGDGVTWMFNGTDRGTNSWDFGGEVSGSFVYVVVTRAGTSPVSSDAYYPWG